MISVEEKVDIFRQDLAQQVELEREEEVGAAAEQAQEQIDLSEIKIAQQKKQIEERFKRLQQRNTAKIISQGKNGAKDMILDLRRELGEDFLELVIKLAYEYMNSELYRNYLKRSALDIKEAFPEPEDLRVFINDKDKQFFNILAEEYLKDYKITYKDLDQKKIGGFIIRDADERISYDYSVRNLIDEKMPFIKQQINEVIKGEVD